MANYVRIIDPAAEWNLREPPPREWVVADMVPAGRLTLFSGDGGTGKTLLGQMLSTSIATGTQWLGRDVMQGPVIALFGEDDCDELHRRQHGINASLGVDMADMHPAKYIEGVSGDCALWTGKGKRTPLLDELVELCRQTRPVLVIIDNAAAVFMGNELIRAEVTAFCRALEREICHLTGAAIMLLSHPSRAGMASGDGLSGSTAWNAAVRSRLYLRKPDKEDPDLRVLEVPKVNYAQAGGQTFMRYASGAFQLENAGTRDQALVDEHTDGLILRAVGILTAAGRTLHPSSNQGTWIVKALQGHPLTARTPKATLERRVQTLRDRGDLVVEKPKRGGMEIRLSANAAGRLALEDGSAA